MRKTDLKESMSLEEASEYWDNHDFGNFLDAHEVSDISFQISRKKYVALDYRLYKEIQKKAKLLHKAETDLINDWLREKVTTSHLTHDAEAP